MRQRHEFTYGKASLVLLTDCAGDPGDPQEGGAGSGTWRFRREDIKRLRLRDYCEESVTRGGDVRRGSGSLADDLRENGYDDPEHYPDEIPVSDADTAIRLLAIMRTKSGEFQVTYDSEGSEYWAWHDIGHAEHDCDIGERWTRAKSDKADGRRGVMIYVDGEREERALVRGARESVRRGVPIAEIVRELASVAAAYSERFEYESSALETFLRGCKVELLPNDWADSPRED
jgi:hypothetical protein